ncbi:MAG TPA: helix-turn-helix domain-containing protein [Methylophilaceae bacterium]|nr:helix-turn-helix domain-containing protein [Methylophilaceae bacterium]
MDIAEVAKLSGLPASTLRFYEEKGLIESRRSQGLRRRYADDILQRLALISLGRSAGFSLDEIVAMFTPAGPEIDRSLLMAKADTLDRRIAELTAMRDGLRHAAACKAPDHLACPKFLRLLKLAANPRFRKAAELTPKKLKPRTS